MISGKGRILPFLLLLLTSCASRTAGETDDSATTYKSENDFTAEASAWVDSVYSRMTQEQRLAQMLMPAVFTRSDAASMAQLHWYAEEIRVGGILLLKGNVDAAMAIADTLQAVRDRLPDSPGTFLALDAETGLGMRFRDAPLFPWNSTINKSVDDQTFYDYGREVGREARLAGINMILGPVVDINRDVVYGGSVMRRRSLGSDQLRVADLSLAYAKGLESQGVASVSKHFPGHGPTATDSHNLLPVITASKDELYTVDLMPFRTVAKNNLAGIMVGHIWAEALDSVRRPASFSPVIMTDLLRKEMEFQGLILVDAVGMGGAKGFTGADAIIAGADIIIAPPDTEKELALLLEAARDGRLSQQRIEETCKRILFVKYSFYVNSDRRLEDETPDDKIKERLYEEAPGIINRLYGINP